MNERVRQLLDGRNHATLATINPDGSPQTSVIWVGRDGDEVVFSTTAERYKTRNMCRDPRVSITIFDHGDPNTYAEIRGTVTFTQEGSREPVEQLAQKYIGREFYPEPPDVVRVTARLTPTKVTGYAA
ncbi:PPOX class F420-dependent oxidoreductase [Longimycelium tulufanense]|uniref:PPOX class F420-dependent oxidoreductase n=1 Tax=Longimycelium tulufanense TaxID=907463 RepID=UPI003570F36B